MEEERYFRCKCKRKYDGKVITNIMKAESVGGVYITLILSGFEPIDIYEVNEDGILV